jgi:hypothetical protein
MNDYPSRLSPDTNSLLLWHILFRDRPPINSTKTRHKPEFAEEEEKMEMQSLMDAYEFVLTEEE